MIPALIALAVAQEFQKAQDDKNRTLFEGKKAEIAGRAHQTSWQDIQDPTRTSDLLGGGLTGYLSGHQIESDEKKSQINDEITKKNQELNEKLINSIINKNNGTTNPMSANGWGTIPSSNDFKLPALGGLNG